MRLRVEFLVEIPDPVSQEEAEEWINFQLGASGEIAETNPMCWQDLNARHVQITPP